MELEDVLEGIITRPAQASTRLALLADYLVERFAVFGLPGVRGGSTGELRIAGLARRKDWDVAYNFAGKDRLLVSLKSIWRNARGTIPNRLDDLMGEAANIQQLSPEIVIGYVILFDAQADSKRADGPLWSEYMEQALQRIAIRRAPLWNQGLLEGIWLIRFDSLRQAGQRLLQPDIVGEQEHVFFTNLLAELHHREPAITFTKPLPDGPV